jgi:hypothetical protein
VLSIIGKPSIKIDINEKLEFKIKCHKMLRYQHKVWQASDSITWDADIDESRRTQAGMGNCGFMESVIFRCLLFLRKSFKISLYGT